MYSITWIWISKCVSNIATTVTPTPSLSFSLSSKLRNAALETLYTQARESPESCSWGEHFQTVLLRLLELLSDEESNVRAMCLRVFREMLKSNGDKLKDYAELATIKVLKGFSDSDSLVSQAAEDTFEFLAPALPFESTVCLLYPMVAQEKYPMLLGTIKLFTKVWLISWFVLLHAHIIISYDNYLTGIFCAILHES